MLLAFSRNIRTDAAFRQVGAPWLDAERVARLMRARYGVALEPDVVFYLNVLPEELVQRSFAKNASLDYWESCMDLGLSRDMFDSFMKYQTAMQKTFRRLQSTYGFTIVDGMRSAQVLNAELQKKISVVLAGK